MLNSQDLVLKVRGLSKSFGARRTLESISFDVKRGEIVSIIGPSGCGKSTLLRCLTWLERPEEGTIEISGLPFGREAKGADFQDQKSTTLDKYRSKIGFVFQQLNVWPHLTVLGNVVVPQKVVLKRDGKHAKQRAHELLEKLGLSTFANRFPGSLSGGQKQRVAIARALAMDPSILLMDEPTSALDPELVGEVHAVIRSLGDNGTTMLVVTHEIRFASRIADRIIFMDGGRIIEEGTTQTVLKDPKDARLKNFIRLATHDTVP